MKIAKKDLKNIEIEKTKNGFVLWVLEKDKKGKDIKHWLLDGSRVKKDGEIQLGSGKHWSINVNFNEKENTIYVVKKKTK